MSNTKFTDGPWYRKGHRVFWQTPDPGLPKDNLLNGLVCICAMTEDNPPEAVEEACANAALISTAPELLESEIRNLPLLQAALEAFEGMLQLYRTDKDVQAAVQEYPMALPPALEETVDALRARIKATRRLIEKAQGIPVQAMEQETKEKQ